jgi:signal transduction histidine kinase
VIAAAASAVATRRAMLRQHELNLQKSSFASAVSHELRAPLGSIRLLAEGLERDTVRDEAGRREYVRLIGQETRRLGALVANVLDFSRIEQGRSRYEFEPTDVLALVHDTIACMQPQASAREVTLVLRAPEPEPALEIRADGRALQQAMVNLMDNALKHSGAGTTVSVAVTCSPTRPPTASDSGHHSNASQCELRIAVCDSGPGVPPDERVRIFEPFYRLGSELRRETPGIGIGLAIVKHIVNAHGGRIEVTSNGTTGACFAMVLPVTTEGGPRNAESCAKRLFGGPRAVPARSGLGDAPAARSSPADERGSLPS